MKDEKSRLPSDERSLFGISTPPIIKYKCKKTHKIYLSQSVNWGSDGTPRCPECDDILEKF
jgi:hypothetical protein